MPSKGTILATYKDRVADAASKALNSPTVSEADYDGCLVNFLSSVADEKHKAKMHWYLMREGMRSVVDRLRHEQRRDVKTLAEPPKTPSHWDLERKERKREQSRYYNELRKVRKEEDEKYAREHRIPIEAVGKHRVDQMFKLAEQNAQKIINIVQDEATQRASEIMLRWLCGGKSLAICTGKDLDAFATKEENQAEGHLQNAFFYRRLRTLVDDAQTVQASVAPDKFLAVFDDVFGVKPNGFFAKLSAEQRDAALVYRGAENHGA